MKKLMQFQKFNGNGTVLGQINYALSLYRFLGGNGKLLKLNDHQSSLLLTELERLNGAPMQSYPNMTWPFDTLPCLVSLRLWKPADTRVETAITAHLRWLKETGLDEHYELPYSAGDSSPPRGCDLSLRISLLAQLDEDLANEIYSRYKKHFWRDRGALAGFAEWPPDTAGREDMDSGPVINGIGVAATGNSLATLLAVADTESLNRLISLLTMRDMAVALHTQSSDFRRMTNQVFSRIGVRLNFDNYYTGFLYGDAALFHALTWTSYGINLQ